MGRCSWASSERLKKYHDLEWGVPSHDDNYLFEMLILEGFQAGLSWDIILKKRKAFQEAFEGFDPKVVSRFDDEKVDKLMSNVTLIRNRLKMISAIKNASAFLAIQQEFGSFDRYIWHFTNNTSLDPKIATEEELMAKTPLSEKVSKDLKKRGFKFVGPVIIQSYLEAIGIYNHHLMSCDWH
ncbi:MAG: DNA-3-methyladenine glycosylase I [Bavariicoccus seileri]|uniref:DNA-3-methyladenine glycosylase I n=1 Tax=Bavariicoccus seileri TaxID=549685 RepID=UPI003F8F328E